MAALATKIVISFCSFTSFCMHKKLNPVIPSLPLRERTTQKGSKRGKQEGNKKYNEDQIRLAKPF